jgi:hypothetical protein
MNDLPPMLWRSAPAESDPRLSRRRDLLLDTSGAIGRLTTVGAPHSPSKTGVNALVCAPAVRHRQGGHEGRRYGWHPHAARCALMRLASSGFRFRRAIFRS